MDRIQRIGIKRHHGKQFQGDEIRVRICSFKQHVKVCKKEVTYKVAMRALCDGRDNNPTHKETFSINLSLNFILFFKF